MKKNWVLVLGLVLASTTVFATRARLESLGENKDGSFFIKDGRNIFLNAAHVNHMKDSLVFEWGDTGNYDTAEKSDAEGGYFKSHGKFTYGVYFGRQADTIRDIRALNAFIPGAARLLANENNLDLYMGGDANGVEWGAAISYSRSKKDNWETETLLPAPATVMTTNAKQSALALRLGAIMGASEAWLNLSLMNSAEHMNGATKEEFDGKMGVQLGYSYGFGQGYKGFFQARHNGGDHTIGAGGFESKYQDLVVGVAKTTALNDNANLFTSISGNYTARKSKTTAGVVNTKERNHYIVAKIGIEADVKEWLTIRGAVGHALYGVYKDKLANTKSTPDDSTTVAAGASVKLSDLTIDGSIGKEASQTVTRLGVTYNF